MVAHLSNCYVKRSDENCERIKVSRTILFTFNLLILQELVWWFSMNNAGDCHRPWTFMWLLNNFKARNGFRSFRKMKIFVLRKETTLERQKFPAFANYWHSQVRIYGNESMVSWAVHQLRVVDKIFNLALFWKRIVDEGIIHQIFTFTCFKRHPRIDQEW